MQKSLNTPCILEFKTPNTTDSINTINLKNFIKLHTHITKIKNGKIISYFSD